MLNSYHILFEIWSKHNLFSKIIYMISFALLIASLFFFILTAINKSNNNEYLNKFEDIPPVNKSYLEHIQSKMFGMIAEYNLEL